MQYIENSIKSSKIGSQESEKEESKKSNVSKPGATHNWRRL